MDKKDDSTKLLEKIIDNALELKFWAFKLRDYQRDNRAIFAQTLANQHDRLTLLLELFDKLYDALQEEGRLEE
ncbi:MAG: hypothetical protein Q4G68_11405 [Planctomycetia bacterium]|nr:hypothetical protein [Planctomycetia bacterium]